jgi:hypothetical protein
MSFVLDDGKRSFLINRIHGLSTNSKLDNLEDHDLRITYLQKFNEYSTRYDLYKDSEFLDFLEDQIKNGSDKHIILECLFILH